MAFPITDSITMEKLSVEILQLAFWNTIPHDWELLQSSAKIRITKQAIGGIVAMLSAYVLRGPHTQGGVGSIQVPATWFQQLKQEKFPKWWLKRWPVVMKEIPYSFEQIINICPHSNVPFGSGGRQHFAFLNPDWRKFNG